MKTGTQRILWILEGILYITGIVMTVSLFCQISFYFLKINGFADFILDLITSITISLLCSTWVSYIAIYYQSRDEYRNHLAELIRINRAIKLIIERCDLTDQHEYEICYTTVCELIEEFKYMRSFYVPLNREDKLAKKLESFPQNGKLEDLLIYVSKALQKGWTKDN